MTSKPNFLFIITDQRRADRPGVTGHPVLETPKSDSIADGGLAFDRIYLANPEFMPNRAASMTGRHSSIEGMRTRGGPVPDESNTFVKPVAEDGYDTALLDKDNHQAVSDAHIGDMSNELGGTGAVELPYCGFDHADVVTMHGDTCKGNYGVWLQKQVENPASLQGPENQLLHDYACPEVIRTEMLEDFAAPENFANDPANKLLRWLGGEERTMCRLHIDPNPLAPRENRLDQNIVVVFTSDHGELMGQAADTSPRPIRNG